jgi:hypothetical protein
MTPISARSQQQQLRGSEDRGKRISQVMAEHRYELLAQFRRRALIQKAGLARIKAFERSA